MSDKTLRSNSAHHEMDESLNTFYRLITPQQWAGLQASFNMTGRELQVAQLICQGYTTESVSGKLNICHGTVKTHLRNIYRKTRVHNKVNMLLLFLRKVGSEN